MNYLELGWDRFFDFEYGHVREAGKVENYRFLENCAMELAENQQRESVFSIMKNFKTKTDC